MRLHATIQNENWKKASKGGNEKLTIGLNRGNSNVATIDFDGEEIKIWYEGNHYWSAKLQGEKRKECKHFIVRDAYDKEYCQECGKYNELS